MMDAYKDANQLIDAYFDDELSDAELKKFEEMLKTDEELLDRFVDAFYFHSRVRVRMTAIDQMEAAFGDLDEAVLLDQQASAEASLLPPLNLESSSDSFANTFQTTFMNILSSPKFLWATMLFSIGTFSILLFMLFPATIDLPAPNHIEHVTHVSQTVDAVWGEGVKEEDLKMLLTGKRLELRSGLAQIKYKNGVRVNLDGPTVYEVSGDNQGTLISGKISAKMGDVPEDFVIETPIGKVTDLGTEFGIEVDKQNNTEVQVFDGKVELAVSKANQNALTLHTRELTERDAVRVDSRKRSIVNAIYAPERFARSYKHLRPYYYDDFSSDSSEKYAVSFDETGTHDGSFGIKNGFLSVRANQATCSVISKRPLLGVQEFFSIEVPGITRDVSEVYAVVSSKSTQPTGGAGGTFGFRLRRGGGIVVQQFDASQIPRRGNMPVVIEASRVDDPTFDKPIRLIIERRTATDFFFYYEADQGRVQIAGPVRNPNLGDFQRLHVGVEFCVMNQDGSADVDNLIVCPLEEEK